MTKQTKEQFEKKFVESLFFDNQGGCKKIRVDKKEYANGGVNYQVWMELPLC